MIWQYQHMLVLKNHSTKSKKISKIFKLCQIFIPNLYIYIYDLCTNYVLMHLSYYILMSFKIFFWSELYWWTLKERNSCCLQIDVIYIHICIYIYIYIYVCIYIYIYILHIISIYRVLFTDKIVRFSEIKGFKTQIEKRNVYICKKYCTNNWFLVSKFWEFP